MAKQDTRTIEFMAFAGKVTDPSHEGNVRRFAKFDGLDAMPLSEGLAAPAESPDGYEMLHYSPLTRNPDGPAKSPAVMGEEIDRRGTLTLLAAYIPSVRGNLFCTVREGDADGGPFATTEAAGRDGEIPHVYPEKWNVPPVPMVSRNTGTTMPVDPEVPTQPEPEDPEDPEELINPDFQAFVYQDESEDEDGNPVPEPVWRFYLVNTGTETIYHIRLSGETEEDQKEPLGDVDHTDYFYFASVLTTDPPVTYAIVPVIDFEVNPLPSPGNYATVEEYEAAFKAWVIANGTYAGIATIPTPEAGTVKGIQVAFKGAFVFESVAVFFRRSASIIWFEEPLEAYYDTRISWAAEWNGNPMVEVLEVVAAEDIDQEDVVENRVRTKLSVTSRLPRFTEDEIIYGSLPDPTFLNYETDDVNAKKSALSLTQSGGGSLNPSGTDVFDAMHQVNQFTNATFLCTGQINSGTERSVTVDLEVPFGGGPPRMTIYQAYVGIPITEVAPFFYKIRIHRDHGSPGFRITIHNKGNSVISIREVEMLPSAEQAMLRPDGAHSVDFSKSGIAAGRTGEIYIQFAGSRPTSNAMVRTRDFQVETIQYSNPERPYEDDPINRIIYNAPILEDKSILDGWEPQRARIMVTEGERSKIFIVDIPFLVNGRTNWGVAQSQYLSPDDMVVYVAVPRDRFLRNNISGVPDFSGIFDFGYREGDGVAEEGFVSVYPLNPSTIITHPHHTVTSCNISVPISSLEAVYDSQGNPAYTETITRSFYEGATLEAPIYDGYGGGFTRVFGHFIETYGNGDFRVGPVPTEPPMIDWYSGGEVTSLPPYIDYQGWKMSDRFNQRDLASYYDFSDVIED